MLPFFLTFGLFCAALFFRDFAFQDVGNLLVNMAVLGHNAAFLQQNTSEHDFMTDDKLALEQWFNSSSSTVLQGT